MESSEGQAPHTEIGVAAEQLITSGHEDGVSKLK